MRSYKTYLVFIFVPYIVLVIMFHSQLPLYEGNTDVAAGIDADAADLPPKPGGNRHPPLPPESEEVMKDRTYRFRDLMLNQGHSFRLHMDQDAVYNSAIKDGLPGMRNRVAGPQPLDPANRVIKNNSLQHGAPQVIINPQSLQPSNMEMHLAGGRNQSLVYQNQDAQFSTISMPMARGCGQNLHDRDSVEFQNILGHYIYSAYFDNRLEDKPFIRIIALLRKTDKPLLYCHIPESRRSGQDQTYVTSIVTYYEMCENHAKDYGGWILSCQVPLHVDTPPCHVVVSLHSSYYQGDKYDVTVPVFVTDQRDSGSKKRDFGVCIPPLFGHIPSTTLVEFIELTQILGAVHFTFYVHEVSLEMTKVLHYYRNVGLISIIPWELPVRPKALWYHGQLLAINDCLYRNMHAFHYVAFNDIDEFVVPHRMSNWSSMVQQLLRPVLDMTLNSVKEDSSSNNITDSHNFCGFTFQSAFFDPQLMGSSSGRVLYDLESDLRTKLFSKVRTKAMVDPSRIFELGIHHISKPLADHYKPYYVDPSEAFLHHYRKCITEFDPKMNCQIFTHDESLSRHIPTLRHNVHHTLWALKEIENLKQLQGKSHQISQGQGRGL